MIATMTLTEFLLARIAEDEYAARLHEDAPRMASVPGSPVAWWEKIAARVLAECEAKRRIVEDHIPDDYADVPGEQFCTRCTTRTFERPLDYPCPTIRALAAIYGDHPDHPDHRGEWRP